jgi:hypothetical protein
LGALIDWPAICWRACAPCMRIPAASWWWAPGAQRCMFAGREAWEMAAAGLTRACAGALISVAVAPLWPRVLRSCRRLNNLGPDVQHLPGHTCDQPRARCVVLAGCPNAQRTVNAHTGRAIATMATLRCAALQLLLVCAAALAATGARRRQKPTRSCAQITAACARIAATLPPAQAPTHSASPPAAARARSRCPVLTQHTHALVVRRRAAAATSTTPPAAAGCCSRRRRPTHRMRSAPDPCLRSAAPMGR